MPDINVPSVLSSTGSALTRALLAFSLPANTRKILGVSDVTDSVRCLHGIRVLSIFWVIVGHTLLFMATVFGEAQRCFRERETDRGRDRQTDK